MKIGLDLPFHFFFGSLSMEVIDAEGKKLFRVTGPTCSCICCSNVDFPVRFFINSTRQVRITLISIVHQSRLGRSFLAEH